MKPWLIATVLCALASASAQPASAGPCEAGFHTFDHPLLATDPVCVPDSPERVVVADFAAFDVMYTLGLPVAAYSDFLITNWYTNMVPELLPAITEALKPRFSKKRWSVYTISASLRRSGSWR